MRPAAIFLILAAVKTGISSAVDKPTLGSTPTTKAMATSTPAASERCLPIEGTKGRWEATIDTVVSIGYNTVNVALATYTIVLAQQQLRAVAAFHHFAGGQRANLA
ncbi:uncharacterized protein BDZ99DRAFT_521537 [Mytilinidion resinicola]|uniref:Uncharacterized protein n=1 Tax=Mytilinidion resinicola TaxID=574789 RepID=A0A6A6YJP0_9PEZI|nr:uncharacterized protein BDZ99DRAFT_521537 [Mytilinidion resinicola]KAF2809072.1 hypothetical protein BDZ99DRAFT_521537 [Mytilinidion resinicola]